MFRGVVLGQDFRRPLNGAQRGPDLVGHPRGQPAQRGQALALVELDSKGHGPLALRLATVHKETREGPQSQVEDDLDEILVVPDGARESRGQRQGGRGDEEGDREAAPEPEPQGPKQDGNVADAAVDQVHPVREGQDHVVQGQGERHQQEDDTGFPTPDRLRHGGPPSKAEQLAGHRRPPSGSHRAARLNNSIQ